MSQQAEGDTLKWVYSKDDLDSTPSREAGMPYAKENFLRQRSLLNINKLGHKLKERTTALPQITISTAQIYFMRFYMRESLLTYKPEDMVPSCIFLACKTQESPRKLRDICETALVDIMKEETSETALDQLRRTILYHEDVLLRVLCYDLHPALPYIHLLDSLRHVSEYHLSSSREQQLRLSAFGFLNDTYTTVVHLLYPKDIIVAAVLYLTFELARVQMRKSWKAQCEVPANEEHRVDEAIDILLEMYKSLDDRTIVDFANSIRTPWHRSQFSEHPIGLNSSLTPQSLGQKTPLSVREGEAKGQGIQREIEREEGEEGEEK
ncbi:cyclin-like protein [Atractiella rhizophila]|nr:cyclin-like protein [Atractiella rhizophila]KAH8915387.1 cyclin-like protein [Atractiella rhizophila]